MKTIDYIGYTALILNSFLFLNVEDCLLTLRHEILSIIITILWFIYSVKTGDNISAVFYVAFLAFNVKDLCSILKKRRNKTGLLAR